ncbi:hypothetical protein M426DRAFT_8644 [Hypoxylon sp. CI-4A]|nr:hypothetical protein M426DRAFT_8644 [Hypoxylon sp. CI-4A]
MAYSIPASVASPLSGRDQDAPLPPGVSEGSSYTGIPDHAPPGLVRVTPAVKISLREYQRELRGCRRYLTNDDVTLFGDIAQYLETGLDIFGNRILMDLTCQICQDKRLEVPLIVSPLRDPDDVYEVEPMVVLPCGHFFGAKCFEHWVETRRDEDMIPDCPLCRLVLAYVECGHHLVLRHYDPRFPRDGQLPLTLPEGGHFHEHCKSCRIEYLKFISCERQEVLFPSGVPGTAFHDADVCGPGDFKGLRNLERDNDLDTFFWAEKRFNYW